MNKMMDAIALLVLYSFTSGQLALAAPINPGKGAALVEGGDEPGETHGTEYVMRRFQGERLIPVRLLGGVRVPGTYYVPQGTDMITVFSLSGGLDQNADTSKILFSRSNGSATETLDLKKALEDRAKFNPSLAANDVIYVEQNKPIISSNTLIVITVVSILISIALGTSTLIKTN